MKSKYLLPLALGVMATTPTMAAQVIATDLIVQGSECVGTDCTSSESFGYDTVRLKENNTRLKFDDTSSSGSFPSRDWQLVANDSNNGGAEYLAIEDVTAGKVPFTVEGGGKNNALYIDSTGKIGFRTTTPVLDLHVATGDTPGLRLEQDSSSGWTAQTWDLAGNETNFFVRDVTHSSQLPFRIRPGAPTSSIDVNSSGDIGVGTDDPVKAVHISRTGDASVRLEVTDASTKWDMTAVSGSFYVTKGGTGGAELIITDSGTVQMGPGGTSKFFLDASGNLTIAGALSQGSDVNSKENIRNVEGQSILDRLSNLRIARWNYKFDAPQIEHIGPMAQEFHSVFGLGDDPTRISSLDVGGIALAGLKEVNEKSGALAGEVGALRGELQARDQQVAELKDRISNLEALVQQLALGQLDNSRLSMLEQE